MGPMNTRSPNYPNFMNLNNRNTYSNLYEQGKAPKSPRSLWPTSRCDRPVSDTLTLQGPYTVEAQKLETQ